MKTFSYNFVIRGAKKDQLRLRITKNRKNAEISLGVSLTREELEDALTAKPKPENRKWKDIILGFDTRITALQTDLASKGLYGLDIKEIKNQVVRTCFQGQSSDGENPAGAFIRHFKTFIEGKSNPGTKGVYEQTLSRIRLFDKGIESKSFEDINLRWLTEFEAFCAKTASKNARNIHLRNIRAVSNSAIDYELTTAYPFRRFKIHPEATRKRSLSVDDLRKLFCYPVEPYAEIYRDMFKLIFFLVGINTVDLHRLKEIKRGRIEYKRAKTGRLYSIKVEPEAIEIIDRYKGAKGLLSIADRWSDHRNFRHQCNKALQRIGEIEKKGRGGTKEITSAFPGLTTYWARHTWATIAFSIGISKDIIAQALGHSDGHDTTNIYIDADQAKVDEANRRVINYVLHGNE